VLRQHQHEAGQKESEVAQFVFAVADW